MYNCYKYAVSGLSCGEVLLTLLLHAYIFPGERRRLSLVCFFHLFQKTSFGILVALVVTGQMPFLSPIK